MKTKHALNFEPYSEPFGVKVIQVHASNGAVLLIVFCGMGRWTLALTTIAVDHSADKCIWDVCQIKR